MIAIVAAAISCGQSVWYCEPELRDADLDRPLRRAPLAEEQVRPEELVPDALEGQDRDRRDGRRREREHHAPVRLEVAGAVELRGLLVVLRDREEVLPHEEEVRRERDAGPEEDVAVQRLREVRSA